MKQSRPSLDLLQLILSRMGFFSPTFWSIAFALALGFGVVGLIILALGANPLVAYQRLFLGAFGSPSKLALTLIRATPVILISLGTIIPFRSSIWNIGQEGQFYIGALAATLVGISLGFLPSIVLIPFLIIAGFVAGGAWSGLAGVLKAKLRADEVITTLMLNFVALLVIDFAVTGPLRDPESRGNPISPPIALSAHLPIIIPGTSLHAGFLIALLFAPVVYFLLFRTSLGFAIRSVGFNSIASTYAGMSVSKIYLTVMLLGGGFAGIAGMSEVAGVQQRLLVGISPGFGATGIVAALLGKLHPFGAVLASIFYASIFIGADEMARATGINTFLVFVIQGIVILAVLATDRWKWFEGVRKWQKR
jgi:simple sugar transport system permease protein